MDFAVISTKYGRRPILDVPALSVESGSDLEVNSLLKAPIDFTPSLFNRYLHLD